MNFIYLYPKGGVNLKSSNFHSYHYHLPENLHRTHPIVSICGAKTNFNLSLLSHSLSPSSLFSDRQACTVLGVSASSRGHDTSTELASICRCWLKYEIWKMWLWVGRTRLTWKQQGQIYIPFLGTLTCNCRYMLQPPITIWCVHALKVPRSVWTSVNLCPRMIISDNSILTKADDEGHACCHFYRWHSWCLAPLI